MLTAAEITYVQAFPATNPAGRITPTRHITDLLLTWGLAARGKHLVAMYTGCGASCSKLF